jgi:hypothetical protein
MKQPTTAAVAAQVAGQKAIEHASDAMQKADRMQRAAGSADVIAVGFDRHRASARPVGHSYIIAKSLSRRRLNDGVGRRIVATQIRAGLSRSDIRKNKCTSRDDKGAKPHRFTPLVPAAEGLARDYPPVHTTAKSRPIDRSPEVHRIDISSIARSFVEVGKLFLIGKFNLSCLVWQM